MSLRQVVLKMHSEDWQYQHPGSMLEMQILGPHLRPTDSSSEGRDHEAILTSPAGDSDAQ